MARPIDLDAALDTAGEVQPLPQGRGLRGMVGATGHAAIEAGTETTLSPAERDELGRCEAIIQRGLRTFVEVGSALLRIRDLRLYRVAYPTFEAYCQERWDMVASRARQLIGAAEVQQNIAEGSVTMVTLPENERQVRPLARLTPDQQRQAWEQAVATAPNGRITAAHVTNVVQAFLQPATPRTPEPGDQASTVANQAWPATVEAMHRHLGALTTLLEQAGRMPPEQIRRDDLAAVQTHLQTLLAQVQTMQDQPAPHPAYPDTNTVQP